MTAATCIFITARWPQIILNFRQRGVGQLNIATTLLYFFGNCIRLYTTATQLGWDALTMTSSSCSACAALRLPFIPLALARLLLELGVRPQLTTRFNSGQLHAGGAVAGAGQGSRGLRGYQKL